MVMIEKAPTTIRVPKKWEPGWKLKHRERFQFDASRLLGRPDLLSLIIPICEEVNRRDKHPGRLWQPDNHPKRNQLAFHKSEATIRAIFGGNQCTSLDTPIWTQRGLIPAAGVEIGDKVIGGTVVSKYLSPTPVKCWKIDCEGGYELVGNSEHPVMTQDGFKELGDITTEDKVKIVFEGNWSESQLSPQDAYFTGLMIGDGCLTHREGVMSFTSGDKELRDWVERYLSDITEVKQEKKPIEIRWCSAAIKEKAEHVWGWTMQTARGKCVPQEVFKDKDVAREFLRGYTDTDGCVYVSKNYKERQVIWISASETLLRQVQQLLLGFGVYATLVRTDKELNGKFFEQWRLRARGIYADRYMERVGCGLERKQNKWQFPDIKRIAPKLSEDHRWIRVRRKSYCHEKFVVGFTVDPTNEYVTGGILSHNSGKSHTTAMEVKWWAEESHPFLDTPPAPEIYIISADYRTLRKGVWRHLKEILYEWEVERWGPIIGSGGEVPTWIKMKNGAHIEFVSGDGGEEARKKLQAAECDLIVIDEEIPEKVWEELQARRLARGGKVIISATLIKSEPWIVALEEKANKGEEGIEAWRFDTEVALTRGHVQESVYNEMLAGLSQEDIEVRLRGNSRVRQGLVYPEFGKAHICKPFDIPADWTRYVSIDPGWRTMACLWGAVAPDDTLYIYREYYSHQKSYRDLANFIFDVESYVKNDLSGEWEYTDKTEKILTRFIDPAGYQTTATGDFGVGHLLATDYGIYCAPAKNSVHPGIERVKQRLLLGSNEQPRLKVFEQCTALQSEFARYRWQKGSDRGNERSDMPLKKHDHALDALRYMCFGNITYTEAPSDLDSMMREQEYGFKRYGTTSMDERLKQYKLRRQLAQQYGDMPGPHVSGLGNEY